MDSESRWESLRMPGGRAAEMGDEPDMVLSLLRIGLLPLNTCQMTPFFLASAHLAYAKADDIEHLSSCARLEHLGIPRAQGTILHEIRKIRGLKYLDASESEIDDKAVAILG